MEYKLEGITYLWHNFLWFLAGWVVCSEVGYAARRLRAILGDYSFLFSPSSEAQEEEIEKDIKHDNEIEEEPETEAEKDINSIFETAISGTLIEETNEEISTEEKQNREKAEEKRILQIGISKKPTTKLGGFFKNPTDRYALASDVLNREKEFGKCKLTSDEATTLTQWWHKKVSGMPYDVAEKIIKEKGYIPHIIQVNNGRFRVPEVYNPTTVNLSISDDSYDFLNSAVSSLATVKKVLRMGQ